MRTANHGLWINAQNCANSNDAAVGRTEDPGIDGGATGRIRLPGQIEQDLWGFAADAQRVVIQYETCRRALMSLIEVVAETGG